RLARGRVEAWVAGAVMPPLRSRRRSRGRVGTRTGGPPALPARAAATPWHRPRLRNGSAGGTRSLGRGAGGRGADRAPGRGAPGAGGRAGGPRAASPSCREGGGGG